MIYELKGAITGREVAGKFHSIASEITADNEDLKNPEDGAQRRTVEPIHGLVGRFDGRTKIDENRTVGLQIHNQEYSGGIPIWGLNRLTEGWSAVDVGVRLYRLRVPFLDQPFTMASDRSKRVDVIQLRDGSSIDTYDELTKYLILEAWAGSPIRDIEVGLPSDIEEMLQRHFPEIKIPGSPIKELPVSIASSHRRWGRGERGL